MHTRPVVAGACLLSLLAIARPAPAQAPASPAPSPSAESLFYSAEWRFVRAGEVDLNFTGTQQADMKLRTLGLVGSLVKVNNSYRVEFGSGWCTRSTLLEAHEGRKNLETRVTYDASAKRAYLLEKDLNSDAIVAQKDIPVPACIHDILGALQAVRYGALPGPPTSQIPVSDGKKAVSARVDSLGKEQVTTPMGTFRAHKLEAFLFGGVLFRRNGRLFIWVSDDDRRLPVQIRVQLPFYIGTVTLRLERAERR